MDLYGITPHLVRAKTHMEANEEHFLRYSALELRFCLEMIESPQVF